VLSKANRSENRTVASKNWGLKSKELAVGPRIQGIACADLVPFSETMSFITLNT
jgi:hypothetical protein